MLSAINMAFAPDERFLNNPAGTSSPAALSNDARANSAPAAARIGSLRTLDLRALPREDGPPTELRTRKEKLAHFEKECTHVGDNIYVGAEAVAKSRQILQAAGITHVVNCVGFLYPPYFEDEVKYQTLYLQDSPHEDILAVLYDVFDFINAAKEEADDGHVLIHCSQGISRSASLAIAYLMLQTNRGYESVFNEVKSKRGVANPNIGFTCQLIQWHRRLTEEAERERLYRLVPQSTSAPQYLVPKMCSAAKHTSLDPRGSFVLHTSDAVYVWIGAQCPEAFTTAAQRFAGQLQRYEDAAEPTIIEQGKETDAFWAALGEKPDGAPTQVKSYDQDYSTYSRSLGSMHHGDTCDSARSGRKTPRSYTGDAAHSPNDRLRKQARSEADLSEQQLERGSSLDSARALAFREEDGGPPRRSALPTLERTSSQPSPRPPSESDLPPLAPRGDRPVLRRPGLPPLNLNGLQPASPRIAANSPRVMASPRPPALVGLSSRASPSTSEASDGSRAESPASLSARASREAEAEKPRNSSRLGGAARPVPRINLPPRM